jgi:WhiB family redox-sensing transcriptional regulator
MDDVSLIPHRPAWMWRSACRGRSIDEFFPEPGASTAAARAVCASCPVRDDCLAFALADRATQGIWAGTDEVERRALRRQRRRAA